MRTLVISALVVEAFFVLMVLSEGTYQFFYVLSLGLILIPYFLSSLFFLKLSVTSQDLFKGKLSGPVAKWVVCGIVGVAFSLFLVYATGIEYVVLMSLLFLLPGVVVYAIGKRPAQPTVLPAFARQTHPRVYHRACSRFRVAARNGHGRFVGNDEPQGGACGLRCSMRVPSDLGMRMRPRG